MTKNLTILLLILLHIVQRAFVSLKLVTPQLFIMDFISKSEPRFSNK